MPLLTVHRKAYTRSDGTRVRAATFKIHDRGARGRTPLAGRFFAPTVHTGWRKDMPQKTRIAKVVRAHGGDLLASARSLQALSNVTTDRRTSQLAASDARTLFARHKKTGR